MADEKKAIEEVVDGASVAIDPEAVARGMKTERDRAVAYLRKYAESSRQMAKDAKSEESKVYQTTIANAMTAMARALDGEFHWKDPQ